MTPPRRRWFRFSLRTLFVVVTLLCVLLGGWMSYQLNWIRRRHDYLREHGLHPMRVTQSAPWSLRPFREPGVSILIVNTDDELAIVRSLFPETSILMP